MKNLKFIIFASAAIGLSPAASAQNVAEATAAPDAADAALESARAAMLDYDFPVAQKHYAEYKRLKTKSKKTLDPDFDLEQQYLREAQNLFERVKDVVVIDALKVPRRDFLSHFRLPASAGRILPTEKLPLNPSRDERGEVGYISESGDILLWSELNDSTGYMTIAEASRLGDGRLTDTRLAPDFLAPEGDALYPFLSADATTLYFASDGLNSMGGLDIFIATRDPASGEYLQPVNAGIPFNSAADDYMLAIDEENGVGWWATDRNRLPGDEITLYVYLLDEERRNVEGSDEMKRDRSTLRDIRKTWIPPVVEASPRPTPNPDPDSRGGALSEADPEADSRAGALSEGDPEADLNKLFSEYQQKAAAIRKIRPGQKSRRPGDYYIPLPGGNGIYSPEDVENSEARTLAEDIFAQQKTLKAHKERLANLRRQFADTGSAATGREIASLELQTLKEERALTRTLSQFYRFYSR